MTTQALSLHELSDYFVHAFPAISEDEQTLALSLYRLLSLGEPVSISQISKETGLVAGDIEQTLQTWHGVFFDDSQQVIGFWGIAVQAMMHRMLVDGKGSYAWCAWDTLFIPELLNKTVKVASSCPVTNHRIELIVSPTQDEATNDKPLYLSFLQPDMDKMHDDVTTNFCHFVYFFDSKSTAEKWLAEHAGTFLLTLEEAFRIAKEVNANRFNLTLHR